MTYGDYPGAEPESARAAARDRARELRELHKKQDRRRRLVLQGGLAAGALVVVALLAIAFLVRPSDTRGPQNMLSDGIKIGQDLKAVHTPAQKPGQDPVASVANSPEVVDIQLYIDYLCANCGTFQQKNSELLRTWVESGAATLEIHPLALLTTKSAGTQYSLRAASAAACVADLSPDHFFDFHDAMFRDQPEEGTEGLSDDEIMARAKAAGVTALGQIQRCVDENRFRTWVKDATARALEGPIPSADVAAIDGTLTVLVNGQPFPYTSEFDPAELASFVVQAAGDAFSSNPTPGPSGSATPTPAP